MLAVRTRVAVFLLCWLFAAFHAECAMACAHPCCHTCRHEQSLFSAAPPNALPAPFSHWPEAAPIAAAALPASMKPVLVATPEINGPPPVGKPPSFAVLKV